MHRGEAVPTAKLTADDVLRMRHLYYNVGTDMKTLSKMYRRVTLGTIKKVVKGESWKHLGMP